MRSCLSSTTRIPFSPFPRNLLLVTGFCYFLPFTAKKRWDLKVRGRGRSYDETGQPVVVREPSARVRPATGPLPSRSTGARAGVQRSTGGVGSLLRAGPGPRGGGMWRRRRRARAFVQRRGPSRRGVDGAPALRQSSRPRPGAPRTRGRRRPSRSRRRCQWSRRRCRGRRP